MTGCLLLESRASHQVKGPAIMVDCPGRCIAPGPIVHMHHVGYLVCFWCMRVTL